MKTIKYLSLLFVLVFCYCGVKLVNSCTQDEFDEQTKDCLMKEFFETIKQKPKGDCSAAYLSMRNCINNVFYGCKKNNSELPNLTKIAQRAQAVIGSEKYYCRDGMLNSFKRINLQPDCQKKATKKVRKCTASFHKEFSEDKARASLCRKYTKAKKCVENVLKKFCKKTASIQYISQMYKDPFNPYCRGRVDTWKPPVPTNRSSRSPDPRFGACSARDYLILTRVCMLQFVQTLQKYPKKPCRSVFINKLENCTKEITLHCLKNESMYVKQNIERSFARNREFQVRKYCDGINFQLSYPPSLKQNSCKGTFLLKKYKCEEDYVMSYKSNKADKSLCRKYADAKRCAKNATLLLCKDTPRLRDEVNFIYDRFNPFCVNLSDPPASRKPVDRLPRKSGTQRPVKASTAVPLKGGNESISSAAQSVTANLLSLLSFTIVPLYLLFAFFS